MNSSEEENILVTRRDYPEMYNEDQSQVSTRASDSPNEVSNNLERDRKNSRRTSNQETDAMTEHESTKVDRYNDGLDEEQVEMTNSSSYFCNHSKDDNDTGVIEGYRNDCTTHKRKIRSNWSESGPVLLRRYEIDDIDQTGECHSNRFESDKSTIQTDILVKPENDIFNIDSRYIIWKGEQEPIGETDNDKSIVKKSTGKAICDSFSQFCSQQSSLLNSSQEDDCAISDLDDSPKTPTSSVEANEYADCPTYYCDMDSGATFVVGK